MSPPNRAGTREPGRAGVMLSRSIPRYFAILVMVVGLLGGTAERLMAGSITWKGEAVEGGLLVGRVTPGFSVVYADQTVLTDAEGHFVIGFTRDEPETVEVFVRDLSDPSGAVTTEVIRVRQREYDIQRIDGLPQKLVTPPKEVFARIRRESAAIGKVRETNSEIPSWLAGFILPAEGPISGVYGSQRILNGEPRQPHYGLDIAGPVGVPVIAPAAGRVSFLLDMYFSGVTMMIDHGHGVQSTFLHLRKSLVKVGDVVKQGQVVAEIGATGRVTAAHLDWRINWFGKRIDPEQVLKVLPTGG